MKKKFDLDKQFKPGLVLRFIPTSLTYIVHLKSKNKYILKEVSSNRQFPITKTNVRKMLQEDWYVAGTNYKFKNFLGMNI